MYSLSVGVRPKEGGADWHPHFRVVEAGGAVHPGLHLNAGLIVVDELAELQGVARRHVADEHGDLGLVGDIVNRLDREHEALRDEVVS